MPDVPMIPLLRRFWPPALWREIVRLREEIAVLRLTPDDAARAEFYRDKCANLRAENAELRRRLDTQQRRDHRGRFVGSVVRP